MSLPSTTEVLVIGGGIHGCGVAQAAAAAGYSTCLVEKSELAAGTSSRSSKLIHGGLRYLESLQFGVVRASVAERELLVRLAPGLVRPVRFCLPIYASSRRRSYQVRLGLSVYSLLGSLRSECRFRALPRAEWDALDGLATNGLQAVFEYRDAQTDDAALVRAVARSATGLGAQVILGVELLVATRNEQGYLVSLRDRDGVEHAVQCQTVVNAAGPWVERVLGLTSPRPAAPFMDLVQGAHIEVAGSLARGVYYVEAPEDRRAVFVMPWGERTLVGTTETQFTGDPDCVAPLPSEVDYLRATLRHYFPGRDSEPLAAWAGLRVLPRAAASFSRRSRELILAPDDAQQPRFVTIYGGKLTSYRRAAEQVLELLCRSLPVRAPLALTAELPLVESTRDDRAS